MKKFLVFGFSLFASFLILNNAHAQDWSSIASGVTNDLNNISCPDTNTCYVVGGAPFIGGPGIVLKTINGGSSWTSQVIPTTNPLRGISCPTISTCYAAGDGGTIIKTINGGTTWAAQSVPVLSTFPGQAQPWFWDIWATSESAAVAVGNVGAIYRTTNGGSTWTQVVAGAENQNLTGVFFVSSTTGWVIGSGLVLKSTNGGTSWSNQTPTNSSFLWDVYSLDGTTVWLSGGTVHKSTDGGASWSRLIGPEGITYRGIHFVSAETGWIVGGAVRKTTSGGSTWTSENSGTSVALRDVECESTSLCYAIGDDGVIIKYFAPAPTPDTIPPSIPTNVRRTSTDTDTTPSFAWDASTDNVGVTRYIVSIFSQGGGDIGFPSAEVTTNSYTVPDERALTAGTIYTLWIRAWDAAGNRSDDSGYLLFTIAVPPDTTAPSAPTNLTRTTPDTDITPTFTWTASTDNVGVTSYTICLDVTTCADTGNVTTYTTSNLSIGSHSFSVKARDAAGNISVAASITFNISAATVVDTTAPSAPGNPIRTSIASDATPTFTWTAATDNVGVTSYEISLARSTDGTILIPATSIGNVLTYTVPDSSALQAGTSYLFAVRARDAAGNHSTSPGLSFTISAPGVPLDTTAPSPPANPTRTSPDNDTTPTFTWTTSPSADVTSYYVDISETTGGTNLFSRDVGNVLTYTLPDSVALTPGSTTYIFHVRAKDAAQNISTPVTHAFVIAAGGGLPPQGEPEPELVPEPEPTPEEEPVSEEEPLPDLAFSTVTLTATNLRLEVANGGESESGDFVLGLQWLDVANQPLGTGATIGVTSLRASGRRNIAIRNTARNYLFRNVPGRATTLAITLDSELQIQESDENNNVRTVSRPLPDLVLRRVTFGARSLRLELRNQAVTLANSFALGLEWLDASGAVVGSERVSTGRLAGRSNRTILLTPTRATNATAARSVLNILFRTAPLGAQRLKIMLDPAGEVAETNDTNNETTVAMPVSLVRRAPRPVQALPDLTFGAYSLTPAALSFTVRNAGSVNFARQVSSIELRWMRANGTETSSRLTIDLEALDAGATHDFNFVFAEIANATLKTFFTAPPADAQRLRIKVDQANAFVELNEGNNNVEINRPN